MINPHGLLFVDFQLGRFLVLTIELSKSRIDLLNTNLKEEIRLLI
jgi:hypothetical protein